MESPVFGKHNHEEAVKGRSKYSYSPFALDMNEFYCSVVLVTFRSSDSTENSQEAWIDPQSESEDAPFVYGRVGDNGEPEYYARISEFLPYALENVSPIKGFVSEVSTLIIVSDFGHHSLKRPHPSSRA